MPVCVARLALRVCPACRAAAIELEAPLSKETTTVVCVTSPCGFEESLRVAPTRNVLVAHSPLSDETETRKTLRPCEEPR